MEGERSPRVDSIGRERRVLRLVSAPDSQPRLRRLPKGSHHSHPHHLQLLKRSNGQRETCGGKKKGTVAESAGKDIHPKLAGRQGLRDALCILAREG